MYKLLQYRHAQDWGNQHSSQAGRYSYNIVLIVLIMFVIKTLIKPIICKVRISSGHGLGGSPSQACTCMLSHII